MQLSAQQFLRVLQRRDRLYDWLLAFVPQHSSGGGSDLDNMPPWLEAQCAQAGFHGKGPPRERLRQVLEQHDWAAGEFRILYRALTSDLQQRLEEGDCFAVGTSHSAEFNGAAYGVPEEFGVGSVLVLPFGAQMLLQCVAVLVTVHLSEQFYRTVAAGGLSVSGYREDTREQALRDLAYGLVRPKLQKAFPPTRLAWELQLVLHRYSTLGVCDSSDVERELVRAFPPQLVGRDNPWAGHPLEIHSWLTHFALRFLVLHECAHVLLNHTSTPLPLQQMQMSVDREYAADQLALRIAMNCSPTPDAAVASVLGAWLFLEVAHWIEQLDRTEQVIADHPPATDRMKRLRDELEVAGSSTKMPVDKCLELLREVETTFTDCWTKSEWQRGDRLAGFNSLNTLLDQSVNERKPEVVRDQIPRWILFGAPPRLSRTLARTRLNLEATVRTNPSDAVSREKLDHVLWVYSVAAQEPSGSLAEELQLAYRKAANSTP